VSKTSVLNSVLKVYGLCEAHRRNFSNFVCRKNCYLNLRAPKNFCMQHVSKVSFFDSANCALASLERQIFLLVKKSITLLTCCINNYIISHWWFYKIGSIIRKKIFFFSLKVHNSFLEFYLETIFYFVNVNIIYNEMT
jgi:hypothetical protein